MSQKVVFTCEDCEAEVTVRLSDNQDDYDIQFCPCCAAPLPLDDDE